MAATRSKEAAQCSENSDLIEQGRNQLREKIVKQTGQVQRIWRNHCM